MATEAEGRAPLRAWTAACRWFEPCTAHQERPRKRGLSRSLVFPGLAAEEFAKDDPFVLNGVVSNWHVREWDEVLVPA